MQILLNSNNEITSYAIVGGFEKSVEVNEIPNDFINNFKPLKYKYENEQIVLNENYSEEVSTPVQPPIAHTPGNDEELRKMFANMQEQMVQGNMMVMEAAQQNAKLAQEVVNLSKEIEALKGAGQDEDAISEI